MENIGEDPHAREREFRQAIERAVAERRRRSRPVQGCLGRFAGILGPRLWIPVVLMFLLPFGGLFVLFFGLHIKWTQVYACSLAQARRSPAVMAEIGDPVTPGFFAWSSSYIQEGSVVDATYYTALEGPKGNGTLYVRWYSAPVGSSLQMHLNKDGRTLPAYAGPAQCP